MSDYTIISNLLSIPTFLFFHLTWLIHSLRRPLLLVSILCILSNPHAAIRKAKLFYLSIVYLILCKDKKWKVPKDDPASYFPKELGGGSDSSNNATYREKTVILIRHGESTWNDTFNAGDRNKLLFVLFFVPNLIKAVIIEVYFFISGKDQDSWFFDSPLSKKGVGQGEGLRKFLKKERMRLGSGDKREEMAIKLLLAVGEERDPSSHVVSSNLRRAISTAAIGLADRFIATNSNNSTTSCGGDDTILLIPSLQEISRNPDALTILPPYGIAHPTWCDEHIAGLHGGDSGNTFTQMINTKYANGNKSLKSNGLIRLNEFAADLFDEGKLSKDTVIIAGHSLFFRSFFQVFLPRNYEHISKKKKLVNGGTVMITFREVVTVENKKEYMIDPSSIVVVYGGFGKHTKG